MKIAALVARNLLGLIFTVFGLNGFFHFINMPPPTGIAAQYLGLLFVSHFLVAVFSIQLLAGVLLLANRFVPLAIVFLGPVLVNILLFHCLMAPEGLPLALVTIALWFVVFFSIRNLFAPLFSPRVAA
jgi:putative oxidoreductase